MKKNYLEKAKDISSDYEDRYIDALIAIAEQLEYNNKLLYAHAMNKKQCKVCGHLSEQEE